MCNFAKTSNVSPPSPLNHSGLQIAIISLNFVCVFFHTILLFNVPNELKQMFKHFLPLILLFSLFFASCTFSTKTGDYDSLEAERDSIAQEMEAMQREMERYFSTINLIEQNIDKIKNAERLISLVPPEGESTVEDRNKINDDLAYISEMLRANRNEIDKLKEQLRQSNFKFDALEKTIARLTKALDEESRKVQALMLELEQRDTVITQLRVDVEELTEQVDSLVVEKEEHLTQIQEQDEAIHTAWYVFGTKKELREQNILTSDGWFRPNRVLESDFNKSYFVRIDTRNTYAIPLYANKAKILSTHPKTSYSLEKENNILTLLISDSKEFWSVSSYLVVEVD